MDIIIAMIHLYEFVYIQSLNKVMMKTVQNNQNNQNNQRAKEFIPIKIKHGLSYLLGTKFGAT